MSFRGDLTNIAAKTATLPSKRHVTQQENTKWTREYEHQTPLHWLFWNLKVDTPPAHVSTLFLWDWDGNSNGLIARFRAFSSVQERCEHVTRTFWKFQVETSAVDVTSQRCLKWKKTGRVRPWRLVICPLVRYTTVMQLLNFQGDVTSVIYIITSFAVVAKISLRSPRKLFNFIFKRKCFFGSKYPKK